MIDYIAEVFSNTYHEGRIDTSASVKDQVSKQVLRLDFCL